MVYGSNTFRNFTSEKVGIHLGLSPKKNNFKYFLPSSLPLQKGEKGQYISGKLGWEESGRKDMRKCKPDIWENSRKENISSSQVSFVLASGKTLKKYVIPRDYEWGED